MILYPIALQEPPLKNKVLRFYKPVQKPEGPFAVWILTPDMCLWGRGTCNWMLVRLLGRAGRSQGTAWPASGCCVWLRFPFFWQCTTWFSGETWRRRGLSSAPRWSCCSPWPLSASSVWFLTSSWLFSLSPSASGSTGLSSKLCRSQKKDIHSSELKDHKEHFTV